MGNFRHTLKSDFLDAVFVGDLEKVKHLVSAGARVTENHNEAVQLAAQHGNLETVKYLVSVGADINDNNWKTITKAASNGRLEIVKYLISIGSKIRGTKFLQNNVAYLAARDGQFETAKYLISVMSDGIHETEVQDLAWLINQSASIAVYFEDLDAIRYFVSIGANPNEIDKEDFRHVVSNGSIGIIKCLIELGFNYHGYGIHKLLGVKQLPRSRDKVLLALDIAIVNNE